MLLSESRSPGLWDPILVDLEWNHRVQYPYTADKFDLVPTVPHAAFRSGPTASSRGRISRRARMHASSVPCGRSVYLRSAAGWRSMRPARSEQGLHRK